MLVHGGWKREGGFHGRYSFHRRLEVAFISRYSLLSALPGCGRFFEGTPAEMHTALNKTLAALPHDTKVYVGTTSGITTDNELTAEAGP